MTTEAPADIPQSDQLKIAREALTRAISAQDFNITGSIDVLVKLQNSLLRSGLPPQLIYHELSVGSQQLLTRAEDSKTEEAPHNILISMNEGFALSHRDFSPPEPQTAQPAATPTRTERLPMSEGKGLPRQPRSVKTQTALKPEAQTNTLTPRESEIVEALKNAKEKTLEDVAKELGIQPQSLRTQISILRRKGVKIETASADSQKITGYYIPEEASDQTKP